MIPGDSPGMDTKPYDPAADRTKLSSGSEAAQPLVLSPVTREELAELLWQSTNCYVYADAILAAFTVLHHVAEPPKRQLLTEPHDGHPDTEECPACPHMFEQPKLDPLPCKHDGTQSIRLFDNGSVKCNGCGLPIVFNPADYYPKGTR